MSKLLDEAHRLEEEALDALYNSYKMPYEDGYFQGVEDMRKLIEKHEKPQLTEEQQEIYSITKDIYEANKERFTQDEDNATQALFTATEWYDNVNFKDKDVVPALKKFLEEVQE